MIRASLEWIGRYGTLLMPAGLIIGCLFQPLAELLRPTLAVCVFLMLVIVLSRLEIQLALAHLRKPKVFLWSLVWAFVAMPALFIAVLHFFPQSPGVNAVLIIYATSPPNFGAAALAFIMGLDGALTVATIFASTALHPIITPLFTETFAQGAIAISGLDLAVRLAGLIGGSSLAAWALRSWLGAERRKASAGIFDGLNVIIMVVFAIALMDGIPARVIAQPAYSLGLGCSGNGTAHRAQPDHRRRLLADRAATRLHFWLLTLRAQHRGGDERARISRPERCLAVLRHAAVPDLLPAHAAAPALPASVAAAGVMRQR